MQLFSIAAVLALILIEADEIAPVFPALARGKGPPPPADLAAFFRPPEKYRADLGSFRSPLQFADGTWVKSAHDCGGR
jgi:hypothetical protein